MQNPIYIEYYSHEKSDCYKINLPWPKYNKDIRVLCTVKEGYEHAKQLAQKEIIKHFLEISQIPPSLPSETPEQAAFYDRLENQFGETI